MINFVKVDKEDFPILAKIAKRIWHYAFDELIGTNQADYMIEKFQSESAFERQTSSEYYNYYFILFNGEEVGYIAMVNRPDEDRLFLSKLYLLPEFHRKGIAVKSLQFVKSKAKEWSKSAVYLTVNKGNARAITVYEKFGFKLIDSVVTDIGGGFVMDDYIYQLEV